MPRFPIMKTLFAFALSAMAATQAAAAAPETVHFTSLDGTTNLTAFLSRPADQGDTPRPAIMLLHGCSGLFTKSGRITSHYRSWTRALSARNYIVLAVDSATPRGFGQTCTSGPELQTMLRDRPKDAYAALQYLQAQSFVQGDHVGIIGFSQGGGVVLLTINDKSIGRQADLAQDFRAAVSFYPGACSDRRQSKPYTEVEPDGWTTKVPLLLLMGEADTWTPFAPCAAFLEAAKARGNPVEIKGYPGAFHAFDAPDLDRIELPAYRTGDGPIPVEATDEEARADATLRVLAFLKQHLE